MHPRNFDNEVIDELICKRILLLRVKVLDLLKSEKWGQGEEYKQKILYSSN